jgi:hypothetical protein
MTAHARALDLAGAGPAFLLAPGEANELVAHLRACADCARSAARLRADAASLGALDPAVSPRLHDRLLEVAVSAPRTGPSPLGLVLVFVLLAVGVVGASIGVGAYLRPVPPAPASIRPASAITWQAGAVDLGATEIRIEQDGATLVGAGTATVDGDPGDATRWTIEGQWTEQGRRQAMFLAFGSDGASWWIRDIRTFDSNAKIGRDTTFDTKVMTTTPVGRPFRGTIDVDNGIVGDGAARIRIRDAFITAAPTDLVNEPVLGTRIVLREGGNAAVDGNPFDSGGPLRCSGILLLSPRAAEARLLALGYSLSWRLQTAESANQGTSVPSLAAPTTGFISGAAIGTSGELIVFVQDPDRPILPAASMPLGCATP